MQSAPLLGLDSIDQASNVCLGSDVDVSQKAGRTL